MKKLARDEQGELMRTREHLVEEIDGAWANLYSSMEQIRRRHYYKLGELLIQLRTTFPKGHKGDRQFSAFCGEKFPAITQPRRSEYVEYRKKMGGKVGSISGEIHRDLPPLRRITKPKEDINRPRDRYRQIVDDEVEEPTRFEREMENEAEMVHELASKIISTGFRILSVKMHPDKNGGSNPGMRRLNTAKKLLQDALIRAAARLI